MLDLIHIDVYVPFDGPHSPAKAVTVDDVLAVPTRTEGEDAAPDECTGRPRPLDKTDDAIHRLRILLETSVVSKDRG